ncbi:unnamed protein product [Closterium sp. NIES-65]|nr:unnamed protein product [Closterium sp. NIES-65]
MRLYVEDLVTSATDPAKTGLVADVAGNVDSDDDDEDDADSLEDGYARICWLGSEEPSEERIEDLKIIDRCFLHGDVVARADDPLGQTGTVTAVELLLDLELASGEILKDVDSRRLVPIRSVKPGGFVVYHDWVGRVGDILDNLVLVFDDGAKCRVTKVSPDDLFPVRPSATDDEESILFWPGQRVRASYASIFRRAQWLKGTWKQSRMEATVAVVEPGTALVQWITGRQLSSGGGGSGGGGSGGGDGGRDSGSVEGEETGGNGDGESNGNGSSGKKGSTGKGEKNTGGAGGTKGPPPDEVSAAAVRALVHFNYVNWQVGDHCLRIEDVVSGTGETGMEGEGGGGGGGGEESGGERGGEGGVGRDQGRDEKRDGEREEEEGAGAGEAGERDPLIGSGGGPWGRVGYVKTVDYKQRTAIVAWARVNGGSTAGDLGENGKDGDGGAGRREGGCAVGWGGVVEFQEELAAVPEDEEDMYGGDGGYEDEEAYTEDEEEDGWETADEEEEEGEGEMQQRLQQAGAAAASLPEATGRRVMAAVAAVAEVAAGGRGGGGAGAVDDLAASLQGLQNVKNELDAFSRGRNWWGGGRGAGGRRGGRAGGRGGGEEEGDEGEAEEEEEEEGEREGGGEEGSGSGGRRRRGRRRKAGGVLGEGEGERSRGAGGSGESAQAGAGSDARVGLSERLAAGMTSIISLLQEIVPKLDRGERKAGEDARGGREGGEEEGGGSKGGEEEGGGGGEAEGDAQQAGSKGKGLLEQEGEGEKKQKADKPPTEPVEKPLEGPLGLGAGGGLGHRRKGAAASVSGGPKGGLVGGQGADGSGLAAGVEEGSCGGNEDGSAAATVEETQGEGSRGEGELGARGSESSAGIGLALLLEGRGGGKEGEKSGAGGKGEGREELGGRGGGERRREVEEERLEEVGERAREEKMNASMETSFESTQNSTHYTLEEVGEREREEKMNATMESLGVGGFVVDKPEGEVRGEVKGEAEGDSPEAESKETEVVAREETETREGTGGDRGEERVGETRGEGAEEGGDAGGEAREGGGEGEGEGAEEVKGEEGREGGEGKEEAAAVGAGAAEAGAGAAGAAEAVAGAAAGGGSEGAWRQFDSVTNAADHYYASQTFQPGNRKWAKAVHKDWCLMSLYLMPPPSIHPLPSASSLLPPPIHPLQPGNRKWAKAVHKDWEILQTNLPDSISVRVYEDRMDLLRVAIVGPHDTPYHLGLFFFDIWLAALYNPSPPLSTPLSTPLHPTRLHLYSISVRVYEDRMDLLRVAIVGPPDTPYHLGLFFFDIWLPPDYPAVPPSVHYHSGGLRVNRNPNLFENGKSVRYHSGGLRVNPNLYEDGKVCLSLLNTWGGKGTEVWNPGSSILQGGVGVVWDGCGRGVAGAWRAEGERNVVASLSTLCFPVLVSIQGLVLVPRPYFNEAGYERQRGSAEGESRGREPRRRGTLLSHCLVLVPRPYFNEAGYERQRGSAEGERNADLYNESAFLLSAKTMIYSIRNPPKHFEPLVALHFKQHAAAILALCDTYAQGTKVCPLKAASKASPAAVKDTTSSSAKDTASRPDSDSTSGSKGVQQQQEGSTGQQGEARRPADAVQSGGGGDDGCSAGFKIMLGKLRPQLELALARVLKGK